MFILLLLYTLSTDIFDGENWTSGVLPLGLGDDMFYILFRSRDLNPLAPLVLWLSGGPGCSLSCGLLGEHGPYVFSLSNPTVLTRNTYSWNSNTDMLYVDNPVGTGFSKATTICYDENCIA